MTFAGKFSAGLSKPNFQRPQDFSTSWWYLFDSVVGNAFNLSSGIFWGLFWKNCNITKVLDLITSFQRFFKKFRQHCPNCHQRILSNILKKKKGFERPEIFRSSSNLENETLGFLVENFQQAFQNWFLQVKWKISRIFLKQVEFYIYFLTFSFFFYKKLRKFFLKGLSKLKSKCHDDFFWKRCRNCIPPVQWNLLGNVFFERVAISQVSCLLDFIVFGMSTKILEALSKMASTSPET